MHASTGARYQTQPIIRAELLICRWLFLFMLLITLRANAVSTTIEWRLPQLEQPSTPTDAPQLNEQQIAELLLQSAPLFTAAQPRAQASALAVNKVQNLASRLGERWLSQFGHARMSVGSDARLKQFRGEVALLLPIDDQARQPLTFSQLGMHYADSQPVVNLGIGQRYLLQEWSLGYNVFFDYQFKPAHSRIGIGTELWRDYLKLSSNGYLAVSGWKNSKAVDFYQEKAAHGFDILAQGYWPAYPHLGAQLKFESYFGEAVALFGQQRDQWQKNPMALTLGISYTPVPLLTLGINQQMGRQHKKQTQVNLHCNYYFYTPWAHQVDPAKVAAQRTLAISRYDWVQRNSQLVLQYRPLAPITLTLPPQRQGYPEELIVLEAFINTRFGFKQIIWDDQALTAAGGQIHTLSATHYQISLPKQPGDYPLTGVAHDQQGNVSTAASTLLSVKRPITLTLPPSVQGTPGSSVDLPIQLASLFGFRELLWEDSALRAAGGTLNAHAGEEDKRWSIVLPNQEGIYTITGTAYDQKGYASLPVTVQVVVSHQPPSVLILTPSTLQGRPGSIQKIMATLTLPVRARGVAETTIEWDQQEFGDGQVGAGSCERPTYQNTMQQLVCHYDATLPKTADRYSLMAKVPGLGASATLPVTVLPFEALAITLPENYTLPAMWGVGETLRLTATGGDEVYRWSSSNPQALTVDEKGVVTIQGAGKAKISVSSAGVIQSIDTLAGKPVLTALPDDKQLYDDAIKLCKKNGATIATREQLQTLHKNRSWAEIRAWAEAIYKPVSGQPELWVWVEDNNNDPKDGLSSINLQDGVPNDKDEINAIHYVLCHFNP